MRRSFFGLSATASCALWCSAIVLGLAATGCAASGAGDANTGGSGGTDSKTTTTTSSSTGTGGEGGKALPCGQDCSLIQTPPCFKSVCNMGDYPGTVGACTVVNADAGTDCDDVLFCTVGDSCDGNGKCVGGIQNDCGMSAPECQQITCDESSKSCSTAPAPNGADCTPTNKCQVNGICKAGVCQGEPKDCSFSPLNECNTVACNPATGACEGTPNTAKNGQKCTLSGDLCMINRTCQAGQCTGGSPKDCSAFTVGCTNGVCDATSGACISEAVPAGGTCFDGIDQCHTGTCDANAKCIAAPVTDGTPCNDHNACTATDVCTAGVCGGTAVTGCQLYFTDDFESCPGGWTFGGDWQCGTPSNAGPASAHGGSGVIATQLAGEYHNNQSYTTTVADSPPISLKTATSPKLSFWVWMNTEGSTYDGFNLKVSTDNGATFTQVTSVTPAYNLTINSQKAWGGDQSAAGWQNYVADLSSFKGHDVIVRFAFRSDVTSTRPGVYIDDILVAEPDAFPLEITTASIPDAFTSNPYAATLARAGGSANATWSVVSGTNNAWLTLDPTTGALSGSPTPADVGPASITVKVQEPSVPSNVAQKTFNFNVVNAVYFQDFEAACAQNGWTLGGDWQCGSPSSVGPKAAYSGARLIATKIAGNYSYNQSYTTAVATSPTIDLTSATNPKLSFRTWVYTEGSTYDGFNLKVSTDGGSTYSLVTAVTPAYPLTIDSEKAWGGNQSALGWQKYTADLSSYVGQQIKLRFAFRSDDLVNYPGVYIDDVLVTSD